MRVVCSLFTSALLVLCIPSASFGGVQRTDPDASSPAGVIYEIPLDTARRDGAPANSVTTSKQSSKDSGGSGTTAGGGGGGGGTSGGGGNGTGGSGTGA